MKKVILAISAVILLSSCATNSVTSFYNKHKNDNNVTAIRVPQFMFALLTGMSPEMNNMVGNIKDLRYIKLGNTSQIKSQLINKEMNSALGSRYTEVYRQNEDLKRTLVSVKEKGSTVKEIVVFKNNGLNSTVLYMNGYFDPLKVRKAAKNNDFDSLTNLILKEYQFIQKDSLKN